jgi:hypothetical protein
MLYPGLFMSVSGPQQRLPVIDGRTACPLLGDIDCERCFECPYLVRLEDPWSLVVVCCPPRKANPPEQRQPKGST